MNRVFWNDIREAQQEVAEERSDSMWFDQAPYPVYPDGVHHTAEAQKDMGLLLGNYIRRRFAA